MAVGVGVGVSVGVAVGVAVGVGVGTNGDAGSEFRHPLKPAELRARTATRYVDASETPVMVISVALWLNAARDQLAPPSEE